MIPLARNVVRIGALIFSAMDRTVPPSGYAPHPARMTGFFALFTTAAAAFRRSPDGRISELLMQPSREQKFRSSGCFWISLGTDSCATPRWMIAYLRARVSSRTALFFS
jgi:hypothetical protein